MNSIKKRRNLSFAFRIIDTVFVFGSSCAVQIDYVYHDKTTTTTTNDEQNKTHSHMHTHV